MHSSMTKMMQPGLLRPKLQSTVDKMYRHVWSNKSKPPPSSRRNKSGSKYSIQDVQTCMEHVEQAPLQIHEKGVSMQDFRNILLKTVRSKIEIRNIFK